MMAGAARLGNGGVQLCLSVMPGVGADQSSTQVAWRSGRLQVRHPDPDPNHLGTLYGNCTGSSPASWPGSGASRSRSATSVSPPAPRTE